MTQQNPVKAYIVVFVFWLLLSSGGSLLAFTFNVASSNVTVLVAGGLSGVINGETLQATLHGSLSYNSGTKRVENWSGTSDYITWDVTAARADTYEVAILYHSTPSEAGSQFEVAVGSSKVMGTVRDTVSLVPNQYYDEDWERIPLSGTLSLPSGGSTVTLRVTVKGGSGEVMKFFALELTPTLAKAAITASNNRAAAQRASTDWFVATHYGLMVHWVGPTMPKGGGSPLRNVYQTATANFNVEAFANMVQGTGAGYLIFHHGTEQYYPAPIAAWEAVRGAGTTTSRDLIGEIADALHQRGIKFIAGYGFDVPGNVWLGVMGLPQRWMNTMTEISQRYGTRLDGYFFDGGWQELYPYNGWFDSLYPHGGPWEPMFAALKVENSARIVSYNFWVYPVGTEWAEYWAGETAEDFDTPLPARYVETGPGQGLQSHVMFPIDDGGYWFHESSSDIGSPIYSNDQLINYIKACNSHGGVVSLNISIYQDGTASSATLAQLAAIKSAIPAATGIPSVNNGAGATNITGNSADFRGNLTITGGTGVTTSVYLFWGTTDGGTNRSAWARTNYMGTATNSTAYTTNIATLSPSTTYYYRFYATNSMGAAWASPSESFTTLSYSPAISSGVATGVTATTAWMNGTLTSTGRYTTTVFVFWGATDGGSNKAAWANTNNLGVQPAVPLSFQVSGLSSETLYYYRFYATNSAGGTWAGSSQSFTTKSAPFNHSAWSYSMKITFGGYTKTETLANFPALVRLSQNLSGFAYSQFKAGGGDLRFTDKDGAELNYEIEKWQTNGESLVWVQVPELANSSAYVWAYWGNPGAATPAYATNGSTWVNGFAGVWHLNEGGTGTRYDATTNRNNGVPLHYDGNEAAAGMIAGADNFNSSDADDAVVIPNSASFDISAVSMSAWIKPTVWDAENVILRKEGAYRLYNRQLSASPPISALTLKIGSGSEVNYSIGNLNSGQWHHVAGTYDRNGGTGNMKLYVNGIEVAAMTAADVITATTNSLCIGMKQDGTQVFKGIIDEARVCSVARSSNWVWACWMNQSASSGFNVYGSISEGGVVVTHGTPEIWLQAKGLTNYVDVAAAENDDPDHDGLKTWQEYYAGTDPTNGDSSAFALNIAYSSGNVLVKFRKTQATGTGYLGLNRYYDLERSSNLVNGAWLPVSTNIQGNGGDFVHTNAVGEALRFYRTKARLR